MTTQVLATRVRSATSHTATHVVIPVVLALATSYVLVRRGNTALALFVAAMPLLLVVTDRIIVASPTFLVVLVMVMNLSGTSVPQNPLLSHPVNVYVPDVLLILLCTQRVVTIFRGGHRRGRLSLAMRAALYIFGAAIVVGTLEGHSTYGIQYISNPTRLWIYSLFMLGTGAASPRDFERGLRIGFYIGLGVTALLGTYYLGTGMSGTTQSSLSTGGVRTIGLSAGMYAAGAMIMALLSLTRRKSFAEARWDWLMVVLGVYVQILSLGRTNLLALALVTPLILLGTRHARRSAAVFSLAFLILASGVALFDVPKLPPQVTTFERRILDTSSQDKDITWREEAARVTLDGLSRHLFTGFGFGRVPVFQLDNVAVPVLGGDPHDGFLYLLAGGGLLALVAFCALLAAAGWALVCRTLRGPPEDRLVLVWAGCFLVVYILNVATGPIISQSQFMPTLWVLLGIPFAASAQRTGRRLIARRPSA